MSRRSRSRSRSRGKGKKELVLQDTNKHKHLIAPQDRISLLKREAKERLNKWIPLSLLQKLLSKEGIVLAGGAVLASCLEDMKQSHDIDLFANEAKLVPWIIDTILAHYDKKTNEFLVQYPEPDSGHVSLVSLYHSSWACPVQIICTGFINASSLICGFDMDYVQAAVVYNSRLRDFNLVTTNFCEESWSTRKIRYVQATVFSTARWFIRLRKAARKGFRVLSQTEERPTLKTSGIWLRNPEYETYDPVSSHVKAEFEVEKRLFHFNQNSFSAWQHDPLPGWESDARFMSWTLESGEWLKDMQPYSSERMKTQVFSRLVKLVRANYDAEEAKNPQRYARNIFPAFVAKMFRLYLDLKEAQELEPEISLKTQKYVENVNKWPPHLQEARNTRTVQCLFALHETRSSEMKKDKAHASTLQGIEDMFTSLKMTSTATQPSRATSEQVEELCILFRKLNKDKE